MTQTLRLGVLVATIGLSLVPSVHAQNSYSGSDLGLTTSGNQIVDQNGNNVRLTGVNWSGFETSLGVVSGLWLDPTPTSSSDFRDYLLKIKDLGFNCVRLPWSYVNMTCNSPAAGTVCNSNSTASYICGAYYDSLNSAAQNASSVNGASSRFSAGEVCASSQDAAPVHG